jgi:hypothetical protein
MRIRIIKAVAGVLDGQSLGQLTPGLVYELDDGLARQLISMACAREEHSEALALVIRSGDEDLDEARLTGGVRVIRPEIAHDAPRSDRRRGVADRRKHPRTDRRTAPS